MKNKETKTVRIPKPLWQKIKVASAQQERKLQDVVVAAIESYLQGPGGVKKGVP